MSLLLMNKSSFCWGKKLFLSVGGFDKHPLGLPSVEGVRSETVNTQVDNGQIIYDTRTLTQNFGSKQTGSPHHNHPEMPGLSQCLALPCLGPWLSRQDQSEKVKYVSQTNHLRCCLFSFRCSLFIFTK